jgi:hypothetical protein
MQDIDNPVVPEKEEQTNLQETPEERAHREWRESRANYPRREAGIYYSPELLARLEALEADQTLSRRQKMEARARIRIEAISNDPNLRDHDPIEALDNLVPPIPPEHFDKFFGRYEDGTIYVKRL